MAFLACVRYFWIQNELIYTDCHATRTHDSMYVELCERKINWKTISGKTVDRCIFFCVFFLLLHLFMCVCVLLLRPNTVLWARNKKIKIPLETRMSWAMFSKQIKYELWLRISIGFIFQPQCTLVLILIWWMCKLWHTSSHKSYHMQYTDVNHRLFRVKCIYALTKLILSPCHFLNLYHRPTWFRTQSDMKRTFSDAVKQDWIELTCLLNHRVYLEIYLHVGYRNVPHRTQKRGKTESKMKIKTKTKWTQWAQMRSVKQKATAKWT